MTENAYKVARAAAASAARWAQRREEWFTAALVKKMSLDGWPVKDTSVALGLGVRDVRRVAERPLVPYAVAMSESPRV